MAEKDTQQPGALLKNQSYLNNPKQLQDGKDKSQGPKQQESQTSDADGKSEQNKADVTSLQSDISDLMDKIKELQLDVPTEGGVQFKFRWNRLDLKKNVLQRRQCLQLQKQQEAKLRRSEKLVPQRKGTKVC
ncbi:Hypp3734 [Branchiostoma lanceolatum]|uniref:Hypp3734 protein n=1 Tax=Branchiostoma lanceolatum TaxID=7740 RepID=A0A8K0A3G4_BRALA|nr:Hypp3734 [Branchiostoma lanceolatum]